MSHGIDLPAGSHTDLDASELLRVFFAIELDESTRTAVSRSQRDLQRATKRDAIRWVREESFHVTLRFIGDVEREQIQTICDCVRDQIARLRPFRLELGGAQPFPSRRRPSFIVLEVGPDEPLEQLAGAVDRGVEAAGLGAEPRPFRPHLTLGRVRGKKKPAVTAGVTALGEGCIVNDAVLFKSDLHPSGAKYTPIQRVPIGGSFDDTHAAKQRLLST